MSEKSQVIYVAANPQQAYLLRAALAEAGIEALVTNDELQNAAGDLPMGWTIAPRVLVPEEQAAEARRLAEEFEERYVEPAHQPDRWEDDGGMQEPAPGRAAWKAPRCPGCHRPRTAVCPVCETAGSDFPPADEPAADEEAGALGLLICPTCDEPFEPGYLRRCEWCGHDFGSGLELPAPLAVAPTEPLNPRVVAAAGATVVLIAALLAYFAWLVAR